MASTSSARRHLEVEEYAPSTSASGGSTTPGENLACRGAEVNHKLRTTLYTMLNPMGLRDFLDSEDLELGDYFPRELEAMIRASLHIAIFSDNHARSWSCLADLSSMLKTCSGIVPILYHVKPKDVRYAKGVYAQNENTPQKLQEWKKALCEVYTGHIINSKKDEDRLLLKNIVYCVLKVIKKVPFVVADCAVGLDFQLTTFQFAETHFAANYSNWGLVFGKKPPYGHDVKYTLATTLYKILNAMEQRCFLDSKEVELGDYLPRKLEAMTSASLHIAIFSDNYANMHNLSGVWQSCHLCLKEVLELFPFFTMLSLKR